MDWELYKRAPGFVLGFHGCDEETGEKVLAGDGALKASENEYDWLGSGIYFWEGNPLRALQFAQAAIATKRVSKGAIKKPFVIGAIIDLGICFNLLDSGSLEELKTAYDMLSTVCHAAGLPLPVNTGGPDKAARRLDRAVIETMHGLRKAANLVEYDTARAAFWEGEPLYPGAGFSQKAHIQIAIRNSNCIHGYFRPIKGVK